MPATPAVHAESAAAGGGSRLLWPLAMALLLLHGLVPACAAERPEFVGRSYELAYDNGFRVRDSFVSDTELEFEVLSAPTPGRRGSVAYQWQRIAPHIYMIFWTEPDGGTVVHVDDFQRRISRSYHTPPGKAIMPSVAQIPFGRRSR